MLASEAPPTNFINIIKHLHLLDQMTPSVYKRIWEKSDGKKMAFLSCRHNRPLTTPVDIHESKDIIQLMLL